MGYVWFSILSPVQLIFLACVQSGHVRPQGYVPPMIQLSDVTNETVRKLALGYPENKGPSDYLLPLKAYHPNFKKMALTWASRYKSDRNDWKCIWKDIYHSKRLLDLMYTNTRLGKNPETLELISFAATMYVCGKPDRKSKWEGCPSACRGRSCPGIGVRCIADNQVITLFVLSISKYPISLRLFSSLFTSKLIA